MGTNISVDALRVIRTYQTSFIGLDFDAALKGLAKTEAISWFSNTQFLYLDKDIKDMSVEEFNSMTRRLHETRTNIATT